MNRRHFLKTVAALSTLSLFPEPFSQLLAQTPAGSRPRITDLEVLRLKGKRDSLTGLNRQYQIQPLHIYPEHRPQPYHDNPNPQKTTGAIEHLYLRIKTDSSIEGLYGPLDSEAVRVVLAQLRPFLIGKDPLAGETLWDQLYRRDRHSRAGHYMMALSAVDNALWDLRGKFFNTPVFRLLGGPTRSDVEAYASCLGYSVEPEPAANRAAQLKSEGFRYQKWFLAYGPGDAAYGLQKNLELVKTLRKTLGDDTEIMFDAYNGWDLQYAIDWAKSAEPSRPHWIEEPFISDQLENFAKLSRATSIPVATGEHFYGRWEVNRFLQADAIKVVQADPEWCGGTSELLKICALASTHGVRVIPHGHGLRAALHVVASQSPLTCPLVEYLMLHKPYKLHFEKDAPAPKAGKIPLPTRPGFGIELDPAKIEDQTILNKLP